MNKLLIGIILLSFLIRVFQFNQVPAALNLDEAAIGYNAYSILKTGADEHGAANPTLFESFGDWKMPLYIYATVPIVALLGLSETSTRLLSLISGVGSVVLIFAVAKKLFQSNKIGLIAALLLAISPWSIFFSRMAIEANLANFLFLIGLFFLLSKKFILSFLFFAATLLTYHTFLIFTPLFLLGFFALNFKKVPPSKTQIVGAVFFVFVTIFAWLTVFQSATTKTTDLGFWNNPSVLYNRVEQFRTPERDSFNKVLHNRVSGLLVHWVENYTASFSPSFLFDKGGEKTLHNTGFSGVLLLSDAIFLLAGLFFLTRAKRLAVKTILLWLILAPISSSLTLDNPSSTRLFVMLPALILLAAFGVKSLNRNWPIALVISGVITISSLVWFDGYFNFLNLKRAQFMGYGFKEVVQELQKNKDFDVVWARAEEFPYIYILFYNKIDPRVFQGSVSHFPKDKGAFNLVKSFGRYSFPSNLNNSKTRDPEFKKNTIYVERFGVHNNSITINLPSGDPRFVIYVSKHDGY